MAHEKQSTKLADLLFPEAKEQDDFAESILDIPPEQRKLHTETYDFAVATLISKLKDGSVFVPEYQRRYVWNDSQASRLIESLIIQCPIPVIYLNQERDERLSVIDGNQRLRSILRFIDNHFKLNGLTAYPELEGNYFHQLDGRFQRHITNRALRCIVILKDTHPQVKFDVFERLNSGSVKLNPQELRHGLYYGDAIQLSADLVKKSGFTNMLDIRQDKRMKAEELVTRFLALHQDFDKYRKPLAGFINSFVEQRRHMDQESKEQLGELFLNTIKKVDTYLGHLAFKIFDQDLNIESKFNSALYDAEMLAFASIKKLPPANKANKQKLIGALSNSFFENEKFRRSISIATSDEQQVRFRAETLKKILSSI